MAGRSGSGDRPAHRYTPADFGLTEAAVDERFAGYLAAHGRVRGVR
jgi:hypothetical protein